MATAHTKIMMQEAKIAQLQQIINANALMGSFIKNSPDENSNSLLRLQVIIIIIIIIIIMLHSIP